MERVIITVAPTGAWPTKENNPNIPEHLKRLLMTFMNVEKLVRQLPIAYT
jgi:uncharacterized protein (DUF849 family)